MKKYIYLILKAAIFDGAVISIIYYFASLVGNSSYQLIIFSFTTLIFAYIWEIYSLKAGKWEYSKKMPLILGVGIMPLIQLTFTGILSTYIAFNFFV